jgi:hypothetical protein
MAGDLETLTRNYWIAVQRVRQMPAPAADKLVVLADLRVLYRAEVRAARAAARRPPPTV